MTTLSSFRPGSSAMTFTCGRDSGAVDLDPRGRTGSGQCGAVREARADDGDVERLRVEAEERAGDQALAQRGVALVEDDDGLGARRLGVDRLDPELARPALDQRDVCRAAEVQAGEVGRLAPAGDRITRRGEHDVDRDDVAAHLAVAGAGEDACAVGRRGRGQLLELRRWHEREVERVELDGPAGGLQPLDDVVDAAGVAGRAGSTVASVGVRDVLEGLLVLEDALDGDAAEAACRRCCWSGCCTRWPRAPRWRLRRARAGPRWRGSRWRRQSTHVVTAVLGTSLVPSIGASGWRPICRSLRTKHAPGTPQTSRSARLPSALDRPQGPSVRGRRGPIAPLGRSIGLRGHIHPFACR